MYGQNYQSGEIILEVTKNEKMLRHIIYLCDVVSKHGTWTYNGLLRDLGLKIEGKSRNRKLVAGSFMYKYADEMKLLKSIENITIKVQKLGYKRGLNGVQNWTFNGLLQSLGVEIEYIEKTKYPKLRPETHYNEILE